MPKFTPVQAVAYRRLADAISVAQRQALAVPCLEEPERWDDKGAPPSLCRWCPALEVCRAYADTGAVQHGLLGGRAMDRTVSRPSRGRRPRMVGVAA